MVIGLLLAAVLSVGASSGTDEPAERLVETAEEAIVLLERELELVPLANPERAGEDGFEDARQALSQVQREGALALAELRAHNIELSPAIVRALESAQPNTPGVERRPPPLDTYAAAIADLRRIAADPTTAAAASGDEATATSPQPAGTSDGSRSVALAAAVGIAAVLAVVLLLIRRHRRHLSVAVEEALTDPLTKLANRRRLDRDLNGLADEPARRVAVLMIDVDHFKQFNDNHGHAVGDAVLREVAALIPLQIRADDVVYRYGGEEFCVLLPGASIAEAHAIAERIRGSVAYVDAPPGARPITVSIGVAENCAMSTPAAIVDADDALLRAKQGGRDRTVVATTV